jgi:hypothetical protein
LISPTTHGPWNGTTSSVGAYVNESTPCRSINAARTPISTCPILYLVSESRERGSPVSRFRIISGTCVEHARVCTTHDPRTGHTHNPTTRAPSSSILSPPPRPHFRFAAPQPALHLGRYVFQSFQPVPRTRVDRSMRSMLVECGECVLARAITWAMQTNPAHRSHARAYGEHKLPNVDKSPPLLRPL